MFSQKKNTGNKNMTNSQDYNPNSVNHIVSGTEIKGEIHSNGDFRFDGVLNGNIMIKGKLVLGPNGIVKGDIQSKNCDLLGRVEGNIRVSELLSLKASAKVHGDIITNKLSIEPGVVFTGSCKMDEQISHATTTTTKTPETKEKK